MPPGQKSLRTAQRNQNPGTLADVPEIGSEPGRIVTAGGRVLGVTGLGDGLPDAIKRTYEAVEKIGFEGAHFRRDISAKAAGKK